MGSSIIDVILSVIPGLAGWISQASVWITAIPDFGGDTGFIFVAGTGFVSLFFMSELLRRKR